jgi:hypothetical protein
MRRAWTMTMRSRTKTARESAPTTAPTFGSTSALRSIGGLLRRDGRSLAAVAHRGLTRSTMLSSPVGDPGRRTDFQVPATPRRASTAPMAKRLRGSNRPGQRRPSSRLAAPAQRPVRPSTHLTADEETRAAELEAQIVAEEKAAQQAARRGRERASRDRDEVLTPARGRELAPLSVRAADEYAYVRRDVLRIVRVGGGLLLVLAILFVLIDVARVVTL